MLTENNNRIQNRLGLNLSFVLSTACMVRSAVHRNGLWRSSSLFLRLRRLAQAWTKKREQSQDKGFCCSHRVPPEFRGATAATGGLWKFKQAGLHLPPHTLHSLIKVILLKLLHIFEILGKNECDRKLFLRNKFENHCITLCKEERGGNIRSKLEVIFLWAASMREI